MIVLAQPYSNVKQLELTCPQVVVSNQLKSLH